MESYRGGMKGYWKRRTYQRLDGSGRRRVSRAELGGGGARRRFWRIKISPRLKLLRKLASSPKRILARIRDAYVRMMLAFAGSGVFAGGHGYCGEAVAGFGRSQLKEYDEKVLVEIYRSIIAQGHLFADAGGGGMEIGIRR